MAEEIAIITGDKQTVYENLLPQLRAMWQQEANLIANLANLTAVLKAQFDWLWIGTYFIDTVADNLVLGPFQGPLACTRIAYGKGVCGTAWKQNKVQIVPDVHDFPGHIACSSAANSEIVLPIYDKNKQIIGVFDIDSTAFAAFDGVDAEYLTLILGDLFAK